MTVDWWNIPVIVALAVSIFGAFWAFLNRKGTEKFQTTTMQPPSWPELWKQMETQEARIDALELAVTKKTNAIANILKSLAAQWPTNAPKPILNKEDLEVLGDTVPREWVSSIKTKGE